MSWLWEHLFSLVKAFWKLGFNCTWLVSTEAFYSDWFLIGLSRGSFTLIGYSMFATGFEFHLIGQPGSKSGLSWNCEVLNEIQEKVVKMLLSKVNDTRFTCCSFCSTNVGQCIVILNTEMCRSTCWIEPDVESKFYKVRLQPIVFVSTSRTNVQHLLINSEWNDVETCVIRLKAEMYQLK